MGDVYRRSILVRLAIGASTGSLLVERARALPDRARRTRTSVDGSIRSSHLVGVARAIAEAANESTLAHLSRNAGTVVRASFCYRWLTAETEPEVVVIDLRDTLSVGPLIAALDRLVFALVPVSHRSTIVDAVQATYEYARDAPVRAASIVLLVAVVASLTLTFPLGDPTELGVLARVVLLGLAALGTRVTASWGELVETRPAQLLVAALEPPEPPEN